MVMRFARRSAPAGRWPGFGGFGPSQPVSDNVARYAITVLGIPESDLRDMRHVFITLRIELRLWNHRRIIIDDERLYAGRSSSWVVREVGGWHTYTFEWHSGAPARSPARSPMHWVLQPELVPGVELRLTPTVAPSATEWRLRPLRPL